MPAQSQASLSGTATMVVSGSQIQRQSAAMSGTATLAASVVVETAPQPYAVIMAIGDSAYVLGEV